MWNLHCWRHWSFYWAWPGFEHHLLACFSEPPFFPTWSSVNFLWVEMGILVSPWHQEAEKSDIQEKHSKAGAGSTWLPAMCAMQLRGHTEPVTDWTPAQFRWEMSQREPCHWHFFSGNCSLSVLLTSASPCSHSGVLERFHPHGCGLRKTASLLEIVFKELSFPRNVAVPLVICACVSIQRLHWTPQGCLGSVPCFTHFSGGEIESNGLKTNHYQSLLQAKQDSKGWNWVL